MQRLGRTSSGGIQAARESARRSARSGGFRICVLYGGASRPEVASGAASGAASGMSIRQECPSWASGGSAGRKCRAEVPGEKVTPCKYGKWWQGRCAWYGVGAEKDGLPLQTGHEQAGDGRAGGAARAGARGPLQEARRGGTSSAGTGRPNRKPCANWQDSSSSMMRCSSSSTPSATTCSPRLCASAMTA